MARTVITPTLLTAEALNSMGAGTAIDATLVTNGISIAAEGDARLLIRITNTAVADKVVTVKAAPAEDGYGLRAGAGPHFQAAKGDLAVTVPADTGDIILTGLPSARFGQDDDASTPNRGALLIDLASGHTGAIWVFRLPKSAV